VPEATSSDGAGGFVFWNHKRPTQVLSVNAIQQKMARYAKAAGMTASCHRLRTFSERAVCEGVKPACQTGRLFVTFGEHGMGLLPARLRIGSKWTCGRLPRHLLPRDPAPAAWHLSQLALLHHQK
jgi:hypothetical protein